MTPHTALDDLHHRAATAPKEVAVVVDERAWTYRELLEESDTLARALAGLGVSGGDRVTLSALNSPEVLAVYYACLSLGAIACPLSPRLTAAELAAALERFTPAAHLGDAALEQVVADAAGRGGADLVRVVIGEAPVGGPGHRWKDLAALGESAELPARGDLDPGAPVVIMSTSGSTGEPKAVAHSGLSLSANIEGLGHVVAGHRSALLATPLVHASGLFFAMACVHSGMPVVLTRERAGGAVVLDLLQERGCSFLMGLPYLFEEMVDAQRARPRQVTSLALAGCTGDVCPVGLQRAFAEVLGVALRPGWGCTEAPGVFTYGLAEGQSSRVLAGTQVRIVEPGDPASAREVAGGQVGELWVRAAALCPGYWVGPGRIEAMEPEGWFRTGDLFRAGTGQHEGSVWFVDRVKNLVVRGEEHVAPAEVEAVLGAHPAVTAAAVLGVERTDGRSRAWQDLFALITIKAGADRDGGPGSGADLVEEITAFAAERLADFKRPDQVRVVDSLPRTALGKVDRTAARELLRT